MQWMTFALLTILLYGVHDILLKHLSGTPALIASLLINGSAAAVLGLILLATRAMRKNASLRFWGPESGWLILAGLCLGLATATFMKTFARGPFSIVLPFVYVGVILLSVMAGLLLFKERISYTQLFGIALSCIGLALMVRK